LYALETVGRSVPVVAAPPVGVGIGSGVAEAATLKESSATTAMNNAAIRLRRWGAWTPELWAVDLPRRERLLTESFPFRNISFRNDCTGIVLLGAPGSCDQPVITV
jgi:hypothetical protein